MVGCASARFTDHTSVSNLACADVDIFMKKIYVRSCIVDFELGETLRWNFVHCALKQKRERSRQALAKMRMLCGSFSCTPESSGEKGAAQSSWRGRVLPVLCIFLALYLHSSSGNRLTFWRGPALPFVTYKRGRSSARNG